MSDFATRMYEAGYLTATQIADQYADQLDPTWTPNVIARLGAWNVFKSRKGPDDKRYIEKEDFEKFLKSRS